MKDLHSGHAASAEYVLYTRRWPMLVLFALAGMMPPLLRLSFAPIQNLMVGYFKVPEGDINLLSVLFQIMYAPSTFVAAWLINKKGLRAAMIAACVLYTIGAWIRYVAAHLGPHHFWLLFGGQAVAACSHPFFATGVTQMAGEWFGDAERGVATTFGAVMVVVSMAIDAALAPYVVRVNAVGADLETYMLGTAGACSAFLVLILLFFQSRPPSPPSAASAAMSKMKTPLRATLIALATNLDFLKILLAFGMGYGTLFVFPTLNNEIRLPEGFTTSEAGYCTMATLLTGVVGAFTFATILDRTHAYRRLLAFGHLGLWISLATFVMLVQFRALTFVSAMIVQATLGFFTLGLLPVALDLGAEVTHPLPPSASTSVLMLVMMLCSIGTTFGAAGLQIKEPPHSMVRALWFILGVVTVGVLFAASFNGRYRRLEMTQMAEDEANARLEPEKESLITKINE